jgi:hypothetical protein
MMVFSWGGDGQRAGGQFKSSGLGAALIGVFSWRYCRGLCKGAGGLAGGKGLVGRVWCESCDLTDFARRVLTHLLGSFFLVLAPPFGDGGFFFLDSEGHFRRCG